MRGVDLTITGPNKSYGCSHVYGTAEGCSPVPCLAAAALEVDDEAAPAIAIAH